MKQDELIDLVAGKTGQAKSNVASVLKATGEVAQAALLKKDELVLPGIGKLSVSSRAARIGRNPSNGQEIKIPAKNVPKFSAAKVLKDAANG